MPLGGGGGTWVNLCCCLYFSVIWKLSRYYLLYKTPNKNMSVCLTLFAGYVPLASQNP